ncbi:MULTISPECIES: mandelate racemase/muconate lactonizing enzyme family protein [Sporosarcina]|uniref:mandelate racemase/muconate lactonizing enzyme family protein n=1 Tax=Sporosarcina TaxID=1569 RepID=UPI001E426F84|nr:MULTISPECIES: dipeptide epimerase [Sporosarcina]GKV64018.1 N-succinyl-L-Arg/Lys racemase [Sporosarcina sp. NCCP-2331]GLB56408.1 N-succinyl-L-Arg/Lys racemase [Sporosarcina sp. NCCP-2378]
MIIKKIDIFAARLPLKEPFVISYVRLEDMPTIFVRVETDNGFDGWGEAVPDQNVTGETWESTYHVIEKELAPLLIGESPFSIDKIHQQFAKKILGTPSAKAALDIALYDLMGKAANLPLYQLLGGSSHEEITVPQVLSIKPPADMAEDARRYVAEGFRSIKIKVGTDAATDIERIRQVRQAIGKEVQLRVDANQGWNRHETLHIIRETADCQVDWFEQPVAAHDLKSLAEIRAVSPVPIMVDEGAGNTVDLLQVIELRAADLVNIKLMKAGGIYPALAVTSMAAAAGMPCQLGSMVESAIGTMAGAHLVKAQSNIKSNEMVGPLNFTKDVAVTIFDNDILHFSGLPGLGITVDENYVQEITKFSCTVQ